MVLWRVPTDQIEHITQGTEMIDPALLLAKVEPSYINISDSTASWTGIYERGIFVKQI